jgi:hypothetical protein
MSGIKVGSKVVCINDKITNPLVYVDFKHWIVEGKTYTVRAICNSVYGSKGVLLEEIVNPDIYVSILHGYIEPAFLISRFAPIEPEKELETEVLEKVLV